MKFIILSGGSGKRLWPLSTNEKPKQLLTVLPNETQTESMLQRIIRQLLEYVNKEDILITTSAVQLEELQKQVSGIQIISEPETRDTFPAISLATLYMLDELNCPNDEVVAVISADAFVDKEFFEKIIELQHMIEQTSALMGLVGIRPTYPSTRFGYIEGKGTNNIFKIEKFIEKPTEENALDLIERGALWNSGIFVFPLRTVADQLKQNDATITYNKLISNFQQLEKISFDYAVVEKLDNIICTTYNGQWDDLGTWDSLLGKINVLNANVRITDDCKNIQVINDINLPIIVMGLSDLIVIATENGILISDEKTSGRLKELMD